MGRNQTERKRGERGHRPRTEPDRPHSSTKPRTRGRPRLVMVLVAVLSAGLGAYVFWPGPSTDALGTGFNVLLITLDTTRADHLACYGSRNISTPNIDALAAEGTMFEQCAAAVPITLPSHASIMTGLDPYVHGVRDNLPFQLAERHVTLAEILRDAGYRTAAHVAAAVVNRPYGLAQGFETYIDAGDRHERRGDEVCDGALAWLRRHESERFFLWVHLFDPHAPYAPPEPFAARYDDPYAGEIAFADQQVGRLTAELHRLGLERNTLVVLTADHGEGRGDHGEGTHLYFIYDATMRVPLIMRCPGHIPAGRRVAAQVRLIDVAPTILALLGRPAAPSTQGVDLRPMMTADADAPKLAAYGETLGGFFAMGLSPIRFLREAGWKYIHAPKPELYHVAEDPGETRNLIDAEPELARDLRDALEALIAEAPESRGDAARRPTADEVRRLAGMGYLSAAAACDPVPSREIDLFTPRGPDPKDHAGDIELQSQATHALLDGHLPQAEAMQRRLVEAFPDSPGPASRLARVLFLQGKDAEAIALYQTIIEKQPDFAEAYYGVAKLLSRDGKSDEAVAYLRKTIDADPDYAEAHYDLGVLLGKAGLVDQAIEHYRSAVRLRPTYTDASFNLAVSLAQTDKLDDAIAIYRGLQKQNPADPTIPYNLGNALVRQNNLAGAASAYEQALRIRPEFQPARDVLNRLRQELQKQPGTP